MMEHEEITVRPADGRDLETLVAFNLAMALETEAKELEADVLRAGVESLLSEPRYGFYVVAERAGAGEVVGSLMVTYEWSDWRNGLFWWIQSVYVTRQFRRRRVPQRDSLQVRQLRMRHQSRDEPICLGRVLDGPS